MADDEDADAFMLLNFLTAKQHKKRTIWLQRGYSTGKQFAGRTIVLSQLVSVFRRVAA